jgi:dTDP-4-amino-4,6-dideoxygalactose transaminase
LNNSQPVSQATQKFIPLARPSIVDEDIALVNEVLRSGMLVQSTYVDKLEHSFAEFHNVNHAIAASNGTATLHLALKALGIGPGDEVIVPAFSYIATANAVELVGAQTVFVDTDDTFNIDPVLVRSRITSKTKAIIPVHEFGLACNIEQIISIADKHNLYVIEDAACALGATQNGKPVGSFGIIGSFSLHPRKSITSGEGGILLTNNGNLATRLRQLRNHGIELIDGKMNFVEAGFNYRLTDFQAALAWSQFQRLPRILENKKQLADIYLSQINNFNLALPLTPPDRNHTWQTFHLLLSNDLNQSDIINYLREKKIGTNYGAQCIPAQIYYQRKYQLDVERLFPNAYRAWSRGLAIPLYSDLSKDDALYVSRILNQI